MNRTRRQFLRDSLGLAAGSVAASCSPGEPPRSVEKRGRVVRATRSAVRTGSSEFDPKVLDEMLGATIRRLTGASSAEAAWKTLFSPNDRVALKVNTLGGPGLSTRPEVVEAIVRALTDIGIDESNILVWDRFNRELIRAGYKINRGSPGYLCYGTEGSYEEEITVHGKIGGFLSPLLAQWPTALINVPLVKDHNLAGVAGSMKNLYGTIDNPHRYHEDNCDPYVADIADLPVVKKKTRLVVCDALNAQCEAGPSYHPKYRWPADSLMAATDMVALDSIARQMIDARRAEAGLKPLAEVGRNPRWLETAAKRGQGVADPKQIEVIEV
jgi:hypothetical protein